LSWKPEAEPGVPGSVLGSSCYHRKCVWKTRVLPLEVAAVKLAYRQKLSAATLRRYASASTWQHASRQLYACTVRYALLRSMGYEHEEAMEDVYTRLPPAVASSEKALSYYESSVREVVEGAEEVVRLNAHRMPETGWSLLTDEERTSDAMLFPATFLYRILHYATSVPRARTELAFCDHSRCYPTPRGVWPGSSWLQLVGQTLRHDIYYHFIQEFGATTMLDYVVNLDVEEFAISIRPGRRATTVTLYVPVENPDTHVVRAAKMQALADAVSRQLELQVVQGTAASASGLEILGVTEEDIKRAVEKTARKKHVERWERS